MAKFPLPQKLPDKFMNAENLFRNIKHQLVINNCPIVHLQQYKDLIIISLSSFAAGYN